MWTWDIWGLVSFPCQHHQIRASPSLSYCLVCLEASELGLEVSFKAKVKRIKTRSIGESMSFHGPWFHCKAKGTAKCRGGRVFSFCNTLLQGDGERKNNQSVCTFAWGSIICLLLSAFSYLSLKSRGPKQSTTDVLVNLLRPWIQLACKLPSQGGSRGLLTKQQGRSATQIDGVIRMSGPNHMFNYNPFFIPTTMTGSYYDTVLKTRMRHGGTWRADRWSVFDQNDQSSLPWRAPFSFSLVWST